MSSIYRKGRDGYFYYQAYVLNKKTGKRDKKVYHSLGTKSETEAIFKKQVFDKKYAKSNKRYNILRFKNVIFFIFALFIMISIYQLVNNLNSKNNNHHIKEVVSGSFDSSEVLSLRYDSLSKKFDGKSEINELDPSSESNKIKNNNLITKKNNLDLEYKIHRIERISGVFEQGKIFVTVPEKYNEDELLMICKKIKSKQAEFLNIIISVYQNNDIGVILAKGEGQPVTPQNIKKSWLAMYSYNSVEGEYFDQNPGDYLKSYKEE